MKVDWFVNGRPVKTGHRFRPSYEFDYVALDILGVYPEDSGVYTCQARNQLGEAVTSCSVRVHAKKDLLLESQHPEGLERIQYLEDASRYKRHELVDEVVNVKPKFITKPKSQENLREGQHAHFECKLEPVTDSNLKVEWFKNGRPVTIGIIVNLTIAALSNYTFSEHVNKHFNIKIYQFINLQDIVSVRFMTSVMLHWM
jgi:hypothetical protein